MYSKNKKSPIKENSSFSSNLLTESTSRLSYSQIKNLKLLKYSVKNKNARNARNPLKIPKLKLETNAGNTNNNFLFSFSQKRKSNKFQNIMNIINNNKSSHIYSLSRNINNSNYYSTEISNYNKSTESKNNNNNIYIKTNNPFYRIYPKRKDSIIDFKDQTRNIRLLKIDSYNGHKALSGIQENILYNEAKTLQFEYSKNKGKMMMNILKDDFHSYLVYLKRKADRESNINEKLFDKKNTLTGEILSLGNKINKILKKFDYYLESKSFLLCVKECSVNFQTFSLESKIEVLYDLYKLYNYKIHNYKIDTFDNINEFKDWIYRYAKNIKENDSLKKSNFFYYIFISIDLNDFYKIFKYINKDYIKNHKTKKIFESIEDFNRNLINNNLHIRLSLNKLNTSITVLSDSNKELIKEKRRKYKIIDIFNSTKDRDNFFSDKLNIEKTKYLANLTDNKIYSKDSNIISKNTMNKIIDKINIILNQIMNYNAADIKKIEFIKTNKKVTTIIDKIRYIEKVMNYLFKYKEEQKYINEVNYEKVMKKFKKEQLIRRFKNKEETMKKLQELKIKKIMDKKDKILFLPYKKVK